MELSGLIFVALALLWAVVLIPKALKHHDEVAKTRSVDSVSDAARVLARREVVTHREARLVVPPRATAVGPPTLRTDAPDAPATPVVPAPRGPVDEVTITNRLKAHRAAAVAATRRRRRILVLLVLIGIGVGVAAGLGAVLPWAPAIPVGITLAYLVLARVLVTREHARWDRSVAGLRSSSLESTPVDPAAPGNATTVEPAPSDELVEVRNHQGVAIVSGLDDTSSFPFALLSDAEATTDPGALWDPLPVTLPTYVSKPRATRSVRTIDLADPTISNSGRDAADSALVAEAATATAAAEGPDQRAVGS